MEDTAICVAFMQLLQACTTFAATAEHGADIRNYGLTPELLIACRRALAIPHEQPIASLAIENSASESAAWHVYIRMCADHGEDFS
jgi:hypothetical protein